jgi:hypothetical protein
MIPVVCRVKHDPEAGTYGDCLRACIASVLEMQAEDVPHFTEDNPGGPIANKRLALFLRSLGFAPFWSNYDGNANVEDVLEHQGVQNPDAVFLLFGQTSGGGDHVIVCRGGEIIHDPAWYRSPMIAPGTHGFWTVMVVAKS